MRDWAEEKAKLKYRGVTDQDIADVAGCSRDWANQVLLGRHGSWGGPTLERIIRARDLINEIDAARFREHKEEYLRAVRNYLLSEDEEKNRLQEKL